MSAQRHPVADLLNDEQRARVRAATFKRVRVPGGGYRIGTPRTRAGRCLCPLAVAAGLTKNSQPSPISLADIFGVDIRKDFDGYVALCNFTSLAETGVINPADVYVMLGCEPLESVS